MRTLEACRVPGCIQTPAQGRYRVKGFESGTEDPSLLPLTQVYRLGPVAVLFISCPQLRGVPTDLQFSIKAVSD